MKRLKHDDINCWCSFPFQFHVKEKKQQHDHAILLLISFIHYFCDSEGIYEDKILLFISKSNQI